MYEKETTFVYLAHPQFGQIRYEASGVGVMPGSMAPIEISSTVGVLGSRTISFQNPFTHTLPVDIVLTSESTDRRDDDLSAFQLLLRRTSAIVISSQSVLQIGVSFTPQTLKAYAAVLQVRSNVEGRPLLWAYPLTGVADAGPSQHLGTLAIACKTSLMKDVVIKLQGLRLEDALDLTLSDLELDISCEPQHTVVITRALRVQPLELIRIDDVTASYAIKYKIRFEPLKVFSTIVNITISCKSLGRWKAELDVESSQPEPDDVIRLRAGVGSSDSVSFRLNNRFLTYSPFKCYFAPRSSTRFSVTPVTGILPPYGAEGSAFTVTFSPTEYGNFQRGRLVVVTDDAQWDYEFIGEFPEYDIAKLDVRSKTNSHR
jgi:hypothetical protein